MGETRWVKSRLILAVSTAAFAAWICAFATSIAALAARTRASIAEVRLRRVIKVLLARGFGFGERSVFFYVELALDLFGLGIGQLRFILGDLRPGFRKLPLGLIERGLERPWIDLKKRLASFDE